MAVQLSSGGKKGDEVELNAGFVSYLPTKWHSLCGASDGERMVLAGGTWFNKTLEEEQYSDAVYVMDGFGSGW